MKEYATISLETHLFFGRIMKEHSLFLLAGFPAKETGFIQRADHFREEFEDGLRKTVKLADGIVSGPVLNSGEVVTEFTRKAECQTMTGCEIRSIILPLLADHVLREANHYLRILSYAQKGRD